jgi:hypothetical protein
LTFCLYRHRPQIVRKNATKSRLSLKIANPDTQHCAKLSVAFAVYHGKRRRVGQVRRENSVINQQHAESHHNFRSLLPVLHGRIDVDNTLERSFMIRTVVLPVALFVVSALLAVMSLQAAGLSLVIGLGMCAYAFVQARRLPVQLPGQQLGAKVMASAVMRAGVALAAGPTIAVVLVLAAMSGVFGHR